MLRNLDRELLTKMLDERNLENIQALAAERDIDGCPFVDFNSVGDNGDTALAYLLSSPWIQTKCYDLLPRSIALFTFLAQLKNGYGDPVIDFNPSKEKKKNSLLLRAMEPFSNGKILDALTDLERLQYENTYVTPRINHNFKSTQLPKELVELILNYYCDKQEKRRYLLEVLQSIVFDILLEIRDSNNQLVIILPSDITFSEALVLLREPPVQTVQIHKNVQPCIKKEVDRIFSRLGGSSISEIKKQDPLQLQPRKPLEIEIRV